MDAADGKRAHRGGLLRAYITPVASGSASRRLAGLLPGWLGSLPRAFSLRSPPEGVAAQALVRAGTFSELVLAGAIRAGLSEASVDWIEHHKTVLFDQGVGRRLQSSDTALIGLTTASRDSFRRARNLGIKRFLDYPTVHHAWGDRLMIEEARRAPEYAFSLQYVAAGRLRRARAEEELALADRILVNSQFAKGTFIEYGIAPERLVEIPFGVELDTFQPRQEAQLNDGQFRVLFAGQISQRKGLSYLLDGFSRAAIPNSELTLVGRIVGTKTPWKSQAGVVHIPPVPYFALPRCTSARTHSYSRHCLRAFPRLRSRQWRAVCR